MPLLVFRHSPSLSRTLNVPFSGAPSSRPSRASFLLHNSWVVHGLVFRVGGCMHGVFQNLTFSVLNLLQKTFSLLNPLPVLFTFLWQVLFFPSFHLQFHLPLSRFVFFELGFLLFFCFQICLPRGPKAKPTCPSQLTATVAVASLHA